MNRKFLKSLNDDIQSDVLYYFLIQEKLNDYKKDPNVFSFDHLQFEIRSLNKMKNHRFDITTLIKCINKYQIVRSLKNAIEEFIQRKNEDKEILSELGDNETLQLDYFNEYELLEFLLIYDLKISRKQIKHFFSLLFREKPIKIIY